MPPPENDWLDERLAVKEYLPDDGFTAQTLGRLPAKRRATASHLRWGILAFSSLIALALFALQIGSLVREVDLLAHQYLSSASIDHAMALCRQPTVQLGAAGALLLLGFAAIPYLRRWA